MRYCPHEILYSVKERKKDDTDRENRKVCVLTLNLAKGGFGDVG